MVGIPKRFALVLAALAVAAQVRAQDMAKGGRSALPAPCASPA